MKVNCVAMMYHPGDYALGQGVAGGGLYGRSYFKKGKKHVEGGFGYERIITPSKYILYAEKKGTYFVVLVDHFFKESVGRLTKKRRLKIEAAMPHTIHIHPLSGTSGAYYIAREDDLIAWKKAANL